MLQQLDAYQKLLQRLVDLQQQLMRAFEAQMELVLPPYLIEYYESIMGHVDWVDLSMRQIFSLLSEWSDRGVLFSLTSLLKQRKGVITVNGQHWSFDAHGPDEICFTHLSPTLDVHLLEQLKQGKTNVLRGVDSWYGGGGDVESQYGRFDAVRAWAAYLFARSIECPFRHLSESEHQALLEALVDKGVLVPWPRGSSRSYFVFAAANGEAKSAEK